MPLVQDRSGTCTWEFGFSALGLCVFGAASTPHDIDWMLATSQCIGSTLQKLFHVLFPALRR